MISTKVFCLALFCVNFKLISGYVSCLNGNGDYVDSYYLYKLPISAGPSKTGLDYLFLSESESKWELDHIQIDSENSWAGKTISQLKASHLVLMYNDEKPTGETDNELGHTKGVIGADEEGGFWLIHSVPKYPDANYKNYSYPSSGHHYGQSFLCISFGPKAMEDVGHQLHFNEPNIYFSQIPERLITLFPTLVSVASKNKLNPNPPFWSMKTLTSKLNSTEFVSFAKSKKFNKELYSDFVAPSLQTDLAVQSWLNGPGRIDSDCTKKFNVHNIEEMSLKMINKDFTTTQDHSKWGVSESQDHSWICIGDINRAEHQKIRGGGTVCRKSPKISNLYRSLVQAVYPCPK